MTGDMSKTAGQWWGDAFTKIAVSILGLAATGIAVWMLSIHTQLATLNVKLDHMAEASREVKAAVIDAQAVARDNARRLDRIEATRFTDQDAQKVIEPIDHRLRRLESNR